MRTVKTFPATIFFVTATAIFFSFVLLALVRMPRESIGDAEELFVVPEDTLVYEDEPASLDSDVPTVVVEDVNGEPVSPAPVQRASA